MKTQYLRGLAVFFLLVLFCMPVAAHEDLNSHRIYKGMGDGFRALMSKDGYGGSLFTLYVHLDVKITNEMGKSKTENLVVQLGTAFIPDCNGCQGRFLLTNNHVADVSKRKDEFAKEAHALYSKLNPPQSVTLHFTEKYKVIDFQGITFLVSLVKRVESPDAALFQFENILSPRRKSFSLQDEGEVSFSPVAVPGSPLDIPNTLGYGHIARDVLFGCGDKNQNYLLFYGTINPGNSGGPLYNLETDKVNGMVTAYLSNDNNNSLISCAVPASALIKFLNENVPLKK